eukprot:TRINITY_DN15655_c0_g1::TRINITY_DN15655_c0_g1_i1::g.18690::m.18690 TRINITY_DN15655_c0_g1::TRINITY_DN15655_c0_g1_i1::g.18690  ORF type:complete len:452 (+),score=165.81,sp/A9UNU6/BYST_MONBE/48.49/6e-135,Bystin/PF05291.6/3.7e-127 TRINITY_DN15655_c0_g1_i1:50-1405(+)
MGKIEKPVVEKKTTKLRHNPLHADLSIEESSSAKKFQKKQVKKQKVENYKDAEEERKTATGVISGKMSRKILQAAKLQRDEIEADDVGGDMDETWQNMKSEGEQITLGGDEDDGDIPDEDPRELEGFGYLDASMVTEDDEAILRMFMSGAKGPTRTLADVIMEKIKEKEQGIADSPVEAVQEAVARTSSMRADAIQLYQDVGKLLKRYRSGKLPKAFKVIPSLRNWEEVILLTEPQEWSAQAWYEATRVFASNLNDKMAQRYYNLALLPKVRQDVAEYKKLNYHLYMALKKALYKPAAWYKGILLPLCEAGDCTLREAMIIGSVMAKVSVPALHSAAALMKLAQMEYSGACSLFMRVLLDKKYNLPRRVVSAVAAHFHRFVTDTRRMPVLWHQCLLTFAQRYRNDISPEDKEQLKEVLKVHEHPYVTNEIRRELFQQSHHNTHHSASMDMD